ncbi:cation-transporting P-type ATPase [Streptomyces sp. NPDC001834]|uniref:cation-transporting P-type ATPase n=1 Tax=Streptomyces sp. NPDC001834 TaxID=3364616 RepID=UPI0036C4A51D
MGTGTSVLTPGDGGHGHAAQEAIHGPAVQTLPTREVFAALGTSPQGLTSAAAAAWRDRFGANELPTARKRGLWRDLARQFTDLFAVMLLVASAITFLAYGLQEPHDVGTPCSQPWRF